MECGDGYGLEAAQSKQQVIATFFKAANEAGARSARFGKDPCA